MNNTTRHRNTGASSSRSEETPSEPPCDAIDAPNPRFPDFQTSSTGDRKAGPASKRLEDVARGYTSQTLMRGGRSQVAIYRMPKYLVWALEALSKHMQRGKDAAADCAVGFGLSRLSKFPGIGEIVKIRKDVVAIGDPEAMSFFEHFGVLDVDTGGAGALDKAHKRHLREDLAEEVGRRAADLGLPVSQLVVIVLTAAFVDASTFVMQPVYRESMRVTLMRFGERLCKRAALAQAYRRTPGLTTPQPDYSFDEVLNRLSNASGAREE